MSSVSRFSEVLTHNRNADFQKLHLITESQKQNIATRKSSSEGGSSESAISAAFSSEMQEVTEDEKKPLVKIDDTEWINFTEIEMRKSFPSGSDPKMISKYSIDKSHLLRKTISENYRVPTDIIGELQISFLLFHYGQLYDGFEQFKVLTNLLCNCEEAITEFSDSVFEPFLGLTQN